MRAQKMALIPAVLLAAGAGPASAMPFPAGYEAAYRAFVNALPASARGSGWLTKFDGVSAPPRPLKLAGKPVQYLFACRNHYCDTDNVNIFLAPDRKHFRAVLELNGKRTLLGGAGPLEVACVRKLDESGGAAENC